MKGEILTEGIVETVIWLFLGAVAVVLEKCTRLFAPIVALKLKFHSNQFNSRQFTAEVVYQSIGSIPKIPSF